VKLDDLILAALALRTGVADDEDLARIVIAWRLAGVEGDLLAALARLGRVKLEELGALTALRDARVARLGGGQTGPVSPLETDSALLAAARDLGLEADAARVLAILAKGGPPIGDGRGGARGSPSQTVTGGPFLPANPSTGAREQPVARELGPRAPDAPRYDLGPVVGRGGIGVVHIAHDTKIGREVAIKVLRGDLPASFARRFVREGRLTARLEHPNIVAIHDLGRLDMDGRDFICMKFIRGRDLGDVIRALKRGEEETRRRFTRARLLQIFLGVCHGVAYAHERGVLHRDLKPRNIMVGDYGEVMIVDWGLAKAVSPDKVAEKPVVVAKDEHVGEDTETLKVGPLTNADLSLPPDPFAKPPPVKSAESSRVDPPMDAGESCAGEILGTPAYMSPEQARGQPATAASDIYSLGAILYEILCHRAAFEGDEPLEVLRLVVAGDLVPPSRRSGSVPEELERLCLLCLSKDPESRPATATWLAERIEEHLEGSREEERRRARSAELAAEASELYASYLAAHSSHRERVEQARELASSIPPWSGVEAKAEVYASLAAAGEAREEAARAYDAAVARAQEALAFDETNEGARNTLGALYLSRLAEAEAHERRGDALLYEALARRYGATESVEARAEIGLVTEPPGARVVLRPLVEDGPFLRPGDPVTLGVTPIERPLLAGRWLIELQRDGMRPVVVSIRLVRGERVDLRIPLYTDVEIGDDMVYVPPGPFLLGGVPDKFGEVVFERRDLPGFFVLRDPITCGEYVRFLADLAIADRDAALARRPRDGLTGPLWGDGRELRFPRERDRAAQHVYSAREPVVGVSWDDAQAFVRWRAALDARAYRIPSELEWEKAARGGDGRPYPWGTRFDDSLANLAASRSDGPGIAEVDAFPHDRSPWGMRGAAGNVREWCREGDGSGPDSPEVPLRITRGGAWHDTPEAARTTFRDALPARDVANGVGFRLVVTPPER
jgi:serine/threonine-protein kinase